MLITLAIIIAVATSLNALFVLIVWVGGVIKELKRDKRRRDRMENDL